VKPDFFRHELLQDLEITHPGKCPMLVFAGLWGHCDKAGRFEWKPRQLKLDILPFMLFEMTETLTILEQAGLLQKYSVDGVEYGLIPSFTEHQRIGGKESQEPEKFPAPNSEAKRKHRGSSREASGKQQGSIGEAVGIAGREGKGREEEGKGVERSRGSRLPLGWEPSEILKAWAVKERPDLDAQDTAARFRDYWQAIPGSKGVKLDWEATFRNWVRNEKVVGRSAAPDYSAVIAGLKD
jgi:hypothetical protein